MRLDLATLIVVIIAMSAAIGVPLALTSGPRRGTGALWYWAMTLLALAGGALLLAAREIIPPVICVMFGNALIIFALALLGETASCLTGSSLDGTNRSFFSVITAPILGLMFFTIDAIWPRIAYMAMVEAYVVLQLACQVHRVRTISAEARRRRPVLVFEVLLWAFFTETLVRTFAVLVLTPAQPFFGQTVIAVAFLVAVILVAGMTCVVVWNEIDAKEGAIRHARSIDIDSGLPNRMLFLQQLEARLAAPANDGIGIVALMRCAPLVKPGASLDPLEEARIYRNVADQMVRFLQPRDMLARTGDNEFGVLFREHDTGQAGATLELALEQLRTRGAMGEGDRYRMSGAAALIARHAFSGSAADLMKLLRGSLNEAEPDRALVLKPY